jgi:hypothetical protein
MVAISFTHIRHGYITNCVDSFSLCLPIGFSFINWANHIKFSNMEFEVVGMCPLYLPF